MEVNKVQAIISLIVVVFFVIVGSFVAIYPMLADVEPEAGYTKHFQNFAALYSGIVGTIIGYYFGKKD